MGEPFLILEVPFNRLLNSDLKGGVRLPAELPLRLVRGDRVAAVVALPVLDVRDQVAAHVLLPRIRIRQKL